MVQSETQLHLDLLGASQPFLKVGLDPGQAGTAHMALTNL
jgi:hypothetical protein